MIYLGNFCYCYWQRMRRKKYQFNIADFHYRGEVFEILFVFVQFKGICGIFSVENIFVLHEI